MSEPSFVKNASAAEKYGDQHVPLQLFADPAGRRFPFHTKAATWCSALELAKHLDGNEYADKIKAAAVIHGIDAEVDSVLSPAPQTIKYAYTQVEPTGVVRSYLPLRHGEEVKTAAAWLSRYRTEIKLADRQKIAAAILDAATEYETELGMATKHELLKQAGRGECHTESLKKALLSRATLLGVNPEAGPLRKLAAAVNDKGSREMRQKTASLLDQLDREFGLVKHYSEGLRAPEDALFEFTLCSLKQAEATEVRLKTGSVFQKQALTRIDRRSVQDWLGDTFADSVWDLQDENEVDHVKLAQVIEKFPVDQARRFEQCAAACGVTPIA